MISKIVHKLAPITLVGGAPVEKAAFDRALTHGPTLVAADGGAAQISAFGHMPEAVIGDMDSLSGDLKAALPAQVIH